MPPIAATPHGIRLTLHIQPRASRTELAGVHGDAVKIRLAAPPVDGAANDELVRFLAGLLGVPSKAVCLTAGQSGRRKTVEVSGVNHETARRRLGLSS
jgi:hypothetical protein